MSTLTIGVSVDLKEGGISFTPDQLSVIGSVASSGTTIEMTSFKQLYIEVEESKAEEAQRLLRNAGVRVLPAGYFTKNLQACHFCRGSEDSGLPLALDLDASIAGIEVPVPLKIGYAGCALGTSEPLTKDISVVKMRDVYDIYLGGDAKGIKPIYGELFMEKIPSEQVVLTVLGIIEYYKNNAKGKEKFRKFMTRMTVQNIKEAVLSESK